MREEQPCIRLRECLERIDRLKIWIIGKNFKANTYLLDSIKDFNNISAIYISGSIKFIKIFSSK